MKKIIIGLIIIAAIIVIYYFSTFNYFKIQKQEIEKQRSGIEVALTNRYDTLVKLNKSVVGYTKHEEKILEKVTQLRSGMSTKELSQAADSMNDAISKIIAVAESYPELKASENFLQLQQTVVDLENTLQATRRLYNQAVSEYNSKIDTIPSCYIATKAGAQKEDYFEAEAIKKNDVELEF